MKVIAGKDCVEQKICVSRCWLFVGNVIIRGAGKKKRLKGWKLKVQSESRVCQVARILKLRMWVINCERDLAESSRSFKCVGGQKDHQDIERYDGLVV